jgi:hypothetical protein
MTNPCYNPALRAASNELQKLLQNLIALSLIHYDIKLEYSEGDDWTLRDEKISYQLCELDSAIVDKATALSIAAARYKEIHRETIEKTANNGSPAE